MFGKKSRTSAGSIIFDTFNSIFMVFLCVTILYPVWDMLVASLSAPGTVSTLTINIWPKNFSIDAYKYCLGESRILSAFFISVSRTVVGTVFHIILVACAAYPLSKLGLPFRKAFMIFFIIPMFFRGGLIPMYVTLRKLGFMDNFLVYIIPTGFSAYVMLIMRNFFMSLDKAVEESALMDGASVITIMFKIIFPLSKPMLATVALWAMVGQWNAWFDAMIYIRDERKIPLQLLLKRIMDETNLLSQDMQTFLLTQPYGVQFSTQSVKSAVTVIVLLPIVCVYPFLQKYFVKGIMLGSVKG